jgi:hypothetical protein
MRERFRERREKNAAVRIRPCQMDGAVQRNDCFPRASGTCDASRPGVLVGDQLTLLGVQEDRPLVPRRIQSAFKFLNAGHDAETPLGIGMRERVGHRHRLRQSWGAARGKLQNRFGGFRGYIRTQAGRETTSLVPGTER